MNKTYALDGVQAILAYPFKQPGWQSKFAISVALFFASYFVPFVPSMFLAGYFAKIMQPVISEEAEPSLPEWNDWGELFKRGAKVVFAAFIYLFPALFFIIAGYLLIYVPLFVTTMAIDADSSTRMPTGLMGISLLGTFVGLAMIFIGFILYFPALLMLPPAITHVIATNSFGAAFRIRQWWRIFRANVWGFFAAMAIAWGAASVLSMMVSLIYFTLILAPLIYVGLALVSVYLGAIAAPLFGEAYRKGVSNLAETANV